MKETLKTRWTQLAPREQRLISWGGSGLLLALLYVYAWQPLNAERLKLRANLPQLRADAALMATQAEEAQHLRQNVQRLPASSPIKAAIQQAMNESGEAIPSAQITQSDDHHANISISVIPFDRWVSWLNLMQQKQHIRLDSCRIEALPQAGMIQLQAVLSSGQ